MRLPLALLSLFTAPMLLMAAQEAKVPKAAKASKAPKAESKAKAESRPMAKAESKAEPTVLTVGSATPALKASRWVKGTPVASLKKGQIYVVEFWATWCGPCRQTIPHLTEMAKKHAGKATFIGVSVWERGESPEKVEASVDAFVKEMGDKMAYSVARDTADGFMANAWMKAAAQNGIPAAFVVDAKGQIAWIGHPMDGLDKVLANVVAGTHDLAAAKAEAEKEAAKDAARTAMIGEFGPGIETAMKAKDYSKLLSVIEQASAKYPNFADMLWRPRFLALLHTDPAKATAALEAEKAKAEGDLITPALVIVNEPSLDKSWHATAAALLDKELKNPEANPVLNGYLAKALHLAGRSDEAAAVQEKLLGLARGKAPEARLKQYEADLKVYQDAAKAGSPNQK